MSRLETESVTFRNNVVAKNIYNNNDQYNAGNPNALSTGDEKGKGLVNNVAGGLTDIKTRDKLITKNKYGYNKEYNSSTA
jgi:hypothetical protein